MKMWCQSTWLYVMLVLGAGVALALFLNWQAWSTAQIILASIYVLLPFHAWEEWRIPGGFGFQYNWVMAQSDLPDRYPMNQLTDMITVLGAMIFGIVLLAIGATPAILLSQTFFSFAEVVMHLRFGYYMHKRFRDRGKRTWYNPGLATALGGFLPLGIAGTLELASTGFTLVDVLIAIALLVTLAAIVFGPERLLAKRENRYAFDPGYFRKFIADGN